MAWFDDQSWRDGYDRWKLASPYDNVEPWEPYCDHSEYDVDFQGYAECICGERWLLTPEEIEAHDRAAAEYYAEEWALEQRREYWRRWRRWWRWLRSFLPFLPYRPTDDEI